MKRKNKNKKIKCNMEIKERIPDTTYSVTFRIDSNVLLNKTKNYIAQFLDSSEKIKLDNFFNEETNNIHSIISKYTDICTSSIVPTELEQSELFQNACRESLKYCYSNREKRVRETQIMLQEEGIENYIKRAKKEGLIEDVLIQKLFDSWTSFQLFDEETRNFYTYLDIYSQVEAEREFYLSILPKMYENAIIDKVGNDLESYIFSKIKDMLRSEIADSFYTYLEKTK